MSMQMYINAHCEAQRRDPVGYARYYDPDWDDDYDPATTYSRVDTSPRPKPDQDTPRWLVSGLKQYLELGFNLDGGEAAARDPEDRFGHLAAEVEVAEDGPFVEVTSDALYLPPAARAGKTALQGDVFLVQTSFTLGAPNGRETPAVKPRLTLDLIEVGGESREAVISASKRKRAAAVELSEDDLTDESGQPQSVVRVKSGISKPKTAPGISEPVVREQVDGKWTVPRHPRTAADGLLLAVLKPKLDEGIKRVRTETPAS